MIIPPKNYRPILKSKRQVLETKLSEVYNQTLSKFAYGYYHFLKGKTPETKFAEACKQAFVGGLCLIKGKTPNQREEGS